MKSHSYLLVVRCWHTVAVQAALIFGDMRLGVWNS